MVGKGVATLIKNETCKVWVKCYVELISNYMQWKWWQLCNHGVLVVFITRLVKDLVHLAQYPNCENLLLDWTLRQHSEL